MIRTFVATLALLVTLASAAVAGPIIPIVVSPNGRPTDFTVLPDGTRVIVSQENVNGVELARITTVSSAGVTLSTKDIDLGAGVTVSGAPAISPNGKYIAVNTTENGQNGNWVYNRDTDQAERRGDAPLSSTNVNHLSTDVDNSGNLVGTVGTDAAVTSASNVVTRLSTPLGGAAATGISESGAIIGYYTDFNLELQAAAWLNGVFTDLSFGASSSMARGVSGDGKTAVGSWNGSAAIYNLASLTVFAFDLLGEFEGLTESGVLWGKGFLDGSKTAQDIIYTSGWEKPMSWTAYLAANGAESTGITPELVALFSHSGGMDGLSFASTHLDMNVPDPSRPPTEPVPEPGSLMLILVGLMGAAAKARHRERARTAD